MKKDWEGELLERIKLFVDNKSPRQAAETKKM